MEILYEFHYNWDHIYLFIFFALFGVVCLSYKINIAAFRQNEIPQKSDIWYHIARFLLRSFGVFCILIAVYSTIFCIVDYTEKKNALANNQVYVVEGYVENFDTPPFGKHGSERFDINGVSFEYPHDEKRNGYDTVAYYGGVITGNGQHLLIKYVTESDGTNTILCIQKIE